MPFEFARRATDVGTFWVMQEVGRDGFWMLANKKGFSSLPPDVQKVIAQELNAAALAGPLQRFRPVRIAAPRPW